MATGRRSFVRLHRLSLESFPSFERFELGTLRRAAYSVAANIVEGLARRYGGERVKFLNVSESSLAEVGYCVHVAGRLGYITPERVRDLEAEIRGLGAPLVGLIRSVRAQADRGTQPT
jgi:four helix bundle protein